MDVLLDGLHVLGILLGGVGIVHAEVGDAVEALGGAEVDAQGLAVADVQIAVGLGREAGVDLHALAALALGQVLLDKGFDKVSGGFFHAFLSQTKDADIINESGRNYKTQYKLYKI